jgi:hypothetical protein
VADRSLVRAAAAIIVAWLAACAPQSVAPPQAERGEPSGFPAAFYQRLQAQGTPVFRVDSGRSLVTIAVRRGGTLAQFGHDHVVASRDVAGYVAPDEGRADLYLPLYTLTVDEPALRATAGFDTQPSPADIEGTRRNMLDKVLEADRYPFATIAVNPMTNGAGTQPIDVAVTLHGVTRTVRTPVRVERAADGIGVTGSFAIDQSQFGIAPFSVLGGAIAVQDRLDIEFRIRARRTE